MKIISGKYKGNKLFTIRNQQKINTRPTTNRVRENLFNILNHSPLLTNGLQNLVVADVFCGFGSFGFEALSQEAKHCYFININSQEIECVHRSAIKLDCEKSCDFICADALALPDIESKIDVLFLDPPYKTSVGRKFLKSPWLQKYLAEKHLVIWEMSKEEMHQPLNWKVIEERIYGKVKLMFLLRHHL